MLDHVSIGVRDFKRAVAFVLDADGYKIEAVCRRPE